MIGNRYVRRKKQILRRIISDYGIDPARPDMPLPHVKSNSLKAGAFPPAGTLIDGDDNRSPLKKAA